MKFEDLKFIAIGGYCASLYVLGKDRLRGPVDNILMLSYKALDLLFKNKYLSFLKNNAPDLIEKRKDLPEASNKFAYEYTNLIRIIHNIPDEKYFIELAKRVENFNRFWVDFTEDKTKFFIFTIPHSFMTPDRTGLLYNKLTEIINFLAKLNILDRVIFVGTRKKSTESAKVWWNNYIPDKDLIEYYKKYPYFKYIELKDISMANDCEKLKVYPKFKKQVENLFNNKKSQSKKQVVKQTTYYLYF